MKSIPLYPVIHPEETPPESKTMPETTPQPTAPPLPQDEGMSFRLKHITGIETKLDNELQHYKRCLKRYKKIYNFFNYTSTTCSSITVASATVGLGFLATGILAPIAIGLEGASILLGVVSLTSDLINKRTILGKLEKHQSICSLASSKLSSIRIMVSKALVDNNISDQEFTHIQNEIDLYRQQKESIQNKTHADLNKLKERYLNEGKQLGLKENLSDRINNLLK